MVTDDRGTVGSEADWYGSQAHVRRMTYVTMAVAAVVLPAVSLPAVIWP